MRLIGLSSTRRILIGWCDRVWFKLHYLPSAIVKWKAEPFPGFDSSQMRPPWRSTMRLHRTWILADCRNERQYQVEIYLSGSNGEQVWGRVIEEFLAGFEPYKG